MVVERKSMRDMLAKIIAYATHKPVRRNVTASPLRIEPPVIQEAAPPVTRRAPAKAPVKKTQSKIKTKSKLKTKSKSAVKKR